MSDNGAALTAGHGCEQINAHRAYCPFPDPEMSLRVDADLADGNVTASVAMACGAQESRSDTACERVTIHGGDGDDVVFGGPLSRVYGDAGDDFLSAGENGSRLDGGYGLDELNGGMGHAKLVGGADGDTIWAGDGWRDRVDGSWARDRANVDRGRDAVSSIERA